MRRLHQQEWPFPRHLAVLVERLPRQRPPAELGINQLPRENGRALFAELAQPVAHLSFRESSLVAGSCLCRPFVDGQEGLGPLAMGRFRVSDLA